VVEIGLIVGSERSPDSLRYERMEQTSLAPERYALISALYNRLPRVRISHALQRNQRIALDGTSAANGNVIHLIHTAVLYNRAASVAGGTRFRLDCGSFPPPLPLPALFSLPRTLVSVGSGTAVRLRLFPTHIPKPPSIAPRIAADPRAISQFKMQVRDAAQVQ